MATGGETTLEAIVLAAGSGARFGGGKLLAPWADGVLLDGALAAARAAPVRSVTVVFGADTRVAQAAAGTRLVHALDHAEGMAASLRAGIAALPPDAAGAFVFLGDMPRVPHAVMAPMAQAKGVLAAAPTFEGRRGHPVLFSRALFPQLLALKGDRGGGSILDSLGERLALIEAPDDGVLFDVDERP